MANIIQPLPTKAGDIGDIARMLLRLLGPAYPAPDFSTNAADAFALGREVSNGRDTTLGSLEEAFPNSATYLLTEWEQMLGLVSGVGRLTTTERRNALLARWRARFSGSSDDIATALAPYNGGFAPEIRESRASESGANPNRVFVFTVKTDIAPTKTADIAPMRAVVEVMKPAHTLVQFTSKPMDGFFCNKADSLTDNTVL